jgi:hypothetical protein
VYGITEDLPGRIDSWKDHGYRVTVMTGVAWGVPRQNAIRRRKWAWFTGSAMLLAVAFNLG